MFLPSVVKEDRRVFSTICVEGRRLHCLSVNMVDAAVDLATCSVYLSLCPTDLLSWSGGGGVGGGGGWCVVTLCSSETAQPSVACQSLCELDSQLLRSLDTTDLPASVSRKEV